MAYKVGIVGVTGAVGQEILALLASRNFPVEELRPLASARSAGKTIEFGGKTWTIREATPESFEGLDFAIFSAGGSISKALAPEAAKRGCIVIDNSSAFRMDPNVPLVVPEINAHALKNHKGIIANPNCSTAITLMGLYPLHKTFGLKRFFASTYQAVSGTGAAAMEELKKQVVAWASGEKLETGVYPYQIAFNLIPHVDSFLEDGYTKEEMKMLNEGRKILELPELAFQIPLLILRLKIEKIALDRSCDTSALLPEQSVLEDFRNIHVMVPETVLYVPDHIFRVILEIAGIKIPSQSPRCVINPHI